MCLRDRVRKKITIFSTLTDHTINKTALFGWNQSFFFCSEICPSLIISAFESKAKLCSRQFLFFLPSALQSKGHLCVCVHVSYHMACMYVGGRRGLLTGVQL